ncbi:MAG: ATP-binding protein [Verrucomicrobia bacterium]|nr:ATP-binding protein [Verrucomicrobiota bacterium]
MSNGTIKPWHEVVKLREDVKSGELTLAMFAADLYDVKMGTAKSAYGDPKEFFTLTFPASGIRVLARDVAYRLAGKSDKAVRQLSLTYGGGKTHALITEYHLHNDPAKLPNVPAVAEFRAEMGGLQIPKARIVVLPFDKLDVEKGMEMICPAGKKRWLKQPWSLLAWQIAGEAGLKLLHASGKSEEREAAPAENLMRSLLELGVKECGALLVLLDEVLMYAHEKVRQDSGWLETLKNFFQYLTQAATKTDRCCVVASLLASDVEKSDSAGRRIESELSQIFQREGEHEIQPVTKEEAAEVLKRRLFDLESIKDAEKFRQQVIAALQGIGKLDEATSRGGIGVEQKYLLSYPFHPELTEVFYAKWSGMPGFQRTRGILRTFALALRDAAGSDPSPLIGPSVFLPKPGETKIPEGLRELAEVARKETYEGAQSNWPFILDTELAKAREIEQCFAALKGREVQQAVIATFVHSQPIGKAANLNELFVLVGATNPDRITLEKALRRWVDVSWFLDESNFPQDDKALPKTWRLGSRPNLQQMHDVACADRVKTETVESLLSTMIGKTKDLTAGASAAGARVHNLPMKPSDIEDDGEFHYAVLGPKCASMSGNPSAEAKRFIEETTGPDRPRVNKNAVVLAVPSRDGLEVARAAVRSYLGWEEVRDMLKGQELDEVRRVRLQQNTEKAREEIMEAIKHAYCIVVTQSAAGDVQAFKIVPSDEPLFLTIKKDPRSRIEDTPVSADALLPGGPYDLWRPGETERRVKDLVGAFAQVPKLPKMLRRREVLETLVDGARQGFFVLRQMRPDKSFRTIWRQEVSVDDIEKDPTWEVVLPESARLEEIPASLLAPDALPELWPAHRQITVADVVNYFAGDKYVITKRAAADGTLYDETAPIPSAKREAVYAGVKAAVETGKLWLVSGVASICGEPIPTGVLADAALLFPPPEPIDVNWLLPEQLPAAWNGNETTALGLANQLSVAKGKALPWPVVRDAIDGAIRARLLERTADSGPWPCPLSGAAAVKLQRPKNVPVPVTPPPSVNRPGTFTLEDEMEPQELMDLADSLGQLLKAAVPNTLKLRVRIELSGEPKAGEAKLKAINAILAKVKKGLELR